MEHVKETGDGIREEIFLLLHRIGEAKVSGPTSVPILYINVSSIYLKHTKENHQ